MLPSEPSTCPYCWESLEIAFDPAEQEHEFWEDCHVCCRPILFQISYQADGGFGVTALSDDD